MNSVEDSIEACSVDTRIESKFILFIRTFIAFIQTVQSMSLCVLNAFQQDLWCGTMMLDLDETSGTG